jgi:hypothetical protein
VTGLLPLRARSRDKPRSYRYLHISEGLRLRNGRSASALPTRLIPSSDNHLTLRDMGWQRLPV